MTELFCPKCGSNNVEYSEDKFFKLGRDTQHFICKDCNYMGALVVEEEK